MKSYVDDIRWLISKVRKGMIWCDITKRLIFDQEQYQKDEGKDDVQKTQEVLIKVMNSIYTDLTFTAENQTDYADDYLSTLDFKMRLNKVTVKITDNCSYPDASTVNPTDANSYPDDQVITENNSRFL